MFQSRFHSGFGNAEHLGGVFDGQAGKESQLHHAALLRIDPRQVVESVVEGDDIEIGLGRGLLHVIDGQLDGGAAALAGIAAARVFDQDLAHEVGRDAEEMGAVFPLRRMVAGEPHKGFVDQRGTLQGVARALAAKIAVGEAPHLVVDEGHQRLQGIARLRIAIGQAIQ